MTRFDVIGFGALNVDTLLKVDKIAGAEEESFIKDYTEACGGSAANTMVGLARLGCKVGFIGKVANDREGKMQIDCFKKEGVDTGGIIQAKKGTSGKVLGFVDRKGARALYVNSGVNQFIEPREIKWEYVSQTQYLHLSSFVGEKSFRTQKKLVGSLPSSIKISFDPGSVYAQKGFAAIEPLIRSSFVMMPNALELQLLTGESEVPKGAAVLLDAGVKIVAVKLGAKGCYVTNEQEKQTIPAFKVQVIDTTGAGDAFNAGFLYGLLHDKTLAECGRLGNFVASRCVMKMGARDGLPYEKDLIQKGQF
ncbi:MAG: carbohydrate kinase family protein [Candidatus Bathyarchaeota archaeon]|nr:carbohydrate kinase family protein [Candidatus Bathyarchaeota archaeon]